jgi:RNA polymerase sigma factor (sigma-70 family)
MDILQEVWYQLSSIIDIEPIEHLSAWLYKVSRNKIIDKSRKKTTLSLEDFAFENEDGELVFPESLFKEKTDPQKELEDMFMIDVLSAALEELPANQREVFILNEIEGFTLQEIAERNSENIKTIISRKRYAVNHLQKKLKNFYEEFYK